jgi:serine/threonine-protein kinase RsbW
MFAHSTEISVSARYAELPGLMDAITRQASELDWAPMDIPRLALVIEELFINTIKHGYGGDSESTVCVDLLRTPDGLTLHYRDRAPAFDPRIASMEPISDESIGGLGLTLIHGLTLAIRYHRADGSNRIELDFVASSGGSAQGQ